MRIALALETLW